MLEEIRYAIIITIHLDTVAGTFIYSGCVSEGIGRAGRERRRPERRVNGCRHKCSLFKAGPNSLDPAAPRLSSAPTTLGAALALLSIIYSTLVFPVASFLFIFGLFFMTVRAGTS